jgi:hypothetical protein
MHITQQNSERKPDYWGTEALKEWLLESHLERRLGPFVALPAREALRRLTTHLVGKGAIVVGQAGNTVTFSYKKDPNWFIFFFLLLIGIIPGLLYGIAASGEVRFSITATPVPQEGGCRLLFGGEHATYAGYREFMRWVDKHQR